MKRSWQDDPICAAEIEAAKELFSSNDDDDDWQWETDFSEVKDDGWKSDSESDDDDDDNMARHEMPSTLRNILIDFTCKLLCAG